MVSIPTWTIYLRQKNLAKSIFLPWTTHLANILSFDFCYNTSRKSQTINCAFYFYDSCNGETAIIEWNKILKIHSM